ncbi:alpha,alpha-trehalose-phosphate synthase TPS1 subunit [Rhizoctonia solani AG-3 Rhs1AP]|uniref:Alpha,alpha-trehalose-phosphate synthase TPS1 subunit n=1 Tax=Rhizoctonia solani AG-3 Rhs1AP TaxID=1086054 RepID=X8JLI2_9AGAM|nr:alpha,alpha-trehalose-phosphate synthase TPS1 subunit [Rhizoctonia solani AG-3 Rhs1AP]
MSPPENLHIVTSPEQFQQFLSADLERVSLLNFWAEWAEPCKGMNQVVEELARTNPQLLTLTIQADYESNEDIAETFNVESVPTFLVLKGHNLLGRIDGADAPALTAAIKAHVHQTPRGLATSDKAPGAPESAKKEETTEELNERMRGLMNQSKVVLFMKGSPDAPRCGFSRQTVAALREQNVEFTHFDILTDESVRQGLKVLNNWPTFPQIIIGGELIGGLDVLKESIENGEFQEMIAT